MRKLNKSRIPLMLARILSSISPNLTPLPKPSLNRVSEQSTVGAVQEDSRKLLPRVVSASQIALFPALEKGPKPHQVTRGVVVEPLYFPKKAVFEVVDRGREEGFREVVNYGDSLPTRIRLVEENSQLCKLPPLTTLRKDTLMEKGGVNFEFAGYRDLSLIHICRCRRYAVCRSRWSPYH
eukprot:TRINITY_DN2758_c0_g6_i2.p1 TRINITY_DN2758_c0_g6~~TRINITY_DN2758_c0_g6_i2.p1  ORF type:complete len:180 (-),score=39.02 TRINITY_DN2758_c0_g6_i2:20-559(-)